MEVAEEIGCLFIFNSGSDKNGKPERTISVYDLQQNCNDCGYRGEYTDKCPKCGSINITNGYGDDTLIFVTSDELVSDGIQLKTDTDAVKDVIQRVSASTVEIAKITSWFTTGMIQLYSISDKLTFKGIAESIKEIDTCTMLMATSMTDVITKTI